MKNKLIIYCSFILTALFMTGCGCGKTNVQPPTSVSPQSVTPSAETTPSSSATQDSAPTMITAEDAKAIALQHADLVAEEVTFSKCELDKELDSTNYDVEFYTEDRIEYDYEIDAYTGEILSYEWDDDEIFFNNGGTQDGTNASANTTTSNTP